MAPVHGKDRCVIERGFFLNLSLRWHIWILTGMSVICCHISNASGPCSPAPPVPAGSHSPWTPRMLHICGCIETWRVCDNENPFFHPSPLFPLAPLSQGDLLMLVSQIVCSLLCVRFRIISGALSTVSSELLRVIFNNAAS